MNLLLKWTRQFVNPLLLLAWAGVLLTAWLLAEHFFHVETRDGRLFGSLVDILNRAVPVALLSLGMTLVIATGGVDLSVGSVMAIGGVVAACLVRMGWTLPWVIGVALLATLAAGVWNGVLVGYVGIQPIVATLILMVAGRGIAQLLTDGQILTFENPGFAFLGGGSFLGLPFTVSIVLMVTGLTALTVRGTALGIFIESIGCNPVASRYSGVSVRRTKLLVYAFSGICAGLAGLIVTSDIKAADANNMGQYLELDAIFAVVMGGTALTGGRFYLLGSLIGVLIIQTLTTVILTRGVAVELTLVIKALAVLGICLFQSDRLRMLWHRFVGGGIHE